MIAMAVGAAVALLALGYVLYPLFVGTNPREVAPSGALCPKCGAVSGAEASFCSGCGSSLDQHPTKTGLGYGS